MLNKLIRRANTPSKRIGLISLVIAILVWTGTALHWNVTKRGFVYQYRQTHTVYAPKPPAVQGHQWRQSSVGWQLVNTRCHRLKSQNNIAAAIVPPKECLGEMRYHGMRITHTWRSSIGRYLDELFSHRWGDYYWLNTAAILLMVVGLCAYSGLAERLFGWVRTGN